MAEERVHGVGIATRSVERPPEQMRTLVGREWIKPHRLFHPGRPFLVLP